MKKKKKKLKQKKPEQPKIILRWDDPTYSKSATGEYISWTSKCGLYQVIRAISFYPGCTPHGFVALRREALQDFFTPWTDCNPKRHDPSHRRYQDIREAFAAVLQYISEKFQTEIINIKNNNEEVLRYAANMKYDVLPEMPVKQKPKPIIITKPSAEKEESHEQKEVVKPKEKKKESNGVDDWGSRIGSIASKINQLFINNPDKWFSMDRIQKAVKSEGPRFNHCKAMVKAGHLITNSNKKFKLAEKKKKVKK